MPFTVCAHALIISALIYPCAFVHAWEQNIILTWSQNMQSVPQKCLVCPLNAKQTWSGTVYMYATHYREEGKGKKEAVQKRWWEVTILQAGRVQALVLWEVGQFSFSFFILTHNCNGTRFSIICSWSALENLRLFDKTNPEVGQTQLGLTLVMFGSGVSRSIWNQFSCVGAISSCRPALGGLVLRKCTALSESSFGLSEWNLIPLEKIKCPN